VVALLVSVASILVRANAREAICAGAGKLGISVVWSCGLQAVWLRRHLMIGGWLASIVSLATFLKASFIVSVVSSAFAA
jgi:hypothetical protein